MIEKLLVYRDVCMYAFWIHFTGVLGEGKRKNGVNDSYVMLRVRSNANFYLFGKDFTNFKN